MLISIGNKKDNVTVIYTPWSNLKKDGSMVAGQVGFKDSKKVIQLALWYGRPENNVSCKVKRIHVATRENPIVNRLNKTKVEEFPDLNQQKEDRNMEIRRRERAVQQQRVRETDINSPFWCLTTIFAAKRRAKAGTRKKGKSMAKGPCLRCSPFWRCRSYVQ